MNSKAVPATYKSFVTPSYASNWSAMPKRTEVFL